MVDAVAIPPINSSHDFQLGIVFARLDSGDKRMDALEGKMADFSHELQGLNGTIIKVKTDLVGELTSALEKQTEELKPIINEKMIRDANAAVRKSRGDSTTNFAIRAAAIIGICGSLFGAIQYIDKTMWVPNHPLAVHETTQGSP